jgi:hypothetical protein
MTKVRVRMRATDPRLHFRLAMCVTILVTVSHAAALPLIASYDGMSYVHLAAVLTSGSFPSEWNFLRTPLFPAVLGAAFRVAGEQPNAALIVTTLLGWGGVVLTGSIAARMAGRTTGAVTLVLLVFYPVLTGYQHMLLSETGTFFCLALLLWCIVAVSQSHLRGSLGFPLLTSFVIGIGYYWRPTILYLSPAVALLGILAGFLSGNNSKPYAGLVQTLRGRTIRILAHFLIFALAPWLIAYPWLSLTAKYAPRVGAEGILAQGAFKQALVPVDHPSLGLLRRPYRTVVERESANGGLPMAGLSAYDNMELMSQVAGVATQIGVVRLIREHPYGYLCGVARSMIFFLGVPGYEGDDENGRFSHFVFVLWPAGVSLDAVPGWDRNLASLAPPPHTGNGLVGGLFDLLLPIYVWLVLAASAVTLICLAISVVRADPVMMAVTGLPVVFLFLHSLTLFNMDRYAFPVYPILLANLVVATSLCFQTLARKLRNRPISSSLRHNIAFTPQNGL